MQREHAPDAYPFISAPALLYHVEVLAAQVADAADKAPARPHRILEPGVRPLLADDAWGEPVAPRLVLGHFNRIINRISYYINFTDKNQIKNTEKYTIKFKFKNILNNNRW